MIDKFETRLAFYRRWSAWALDQSIRSPNEQVKNRCEACAVAWSQIADVIENGDELRLSRLTHNVYLFNPWGLRSELEETDAF
jgi:hypothetical protein